MKTLLASALALLVCSPAQKLSFAPETGTEVEKAFSSTMILKMTEMSQTVTMDGEELEDDGDEDALEMTMVVNSAIAFTDRYDAIEDGKVIKLTRSFGGLKSTQLGSAPGEDGELEDFQEDGASFLMGSVVSFEWDAEEDEYKIRFAKDEDEMDEELLEGLQVEADFTFLLPEEEVDVDETWTIPASVLDSIWRPGGDLKIVMQSETEDENDDFEIQFAENLKGELECTLVSVEEGKATISFEGEVSTTVEEEFEEEGMSGSQSFEFEYELKGKLIWSVEKNRAVSMKMEGPLSMTIESEQEFDAFSVTGTQVFEGTIKDEVTFK